MSIVGKALEELFHVFVDQAVVRQLSSKFRQLFGIRQVAVQQQPGNFDKVGLLCQLFDGVSAITQNPFFAINECDRAVARSGAGEGGINSNGPGLRSQLANVDADFAFTAGNHREFVIFSIQRKIGCCHETFPKSNRCARPWTAELTLLTRWQLICLPTAVDQRGGRKNHQKFA